MFEELSLPPIESFRNDLNNEECSQSDYQFANKVWENLGLRNFGEYLDFNLKLDVCLLADTLTSFRKTCLEVFGIDCCHMYTIPSFAYKIMLHMSKVSLELITDADMLLFVQSAVRGGACSMLPDISAYAGANNPLLSNPSKYYKTSEPDSYLQMLDCVNLYGYAQSQPLP